MWLSVEPTMPNLYGFVPKTILKRQTILQRFAGILTSEHVICFHSGNAIKVADIPGFVIGKFVVG